VDPDWDLRPQGFDTFCRILIPKKIIGMHYEKIIYVLSFFVCVATGSAMVTMTDAILQNPLKFFISDHYFIKIYHLP
jgi:multisubunit Na+/H+ antiporter MnhB subunit